MHETTYHEIAKTGSLYYLINAFIGAYNRRTDVVGAGLQAIALALATPQDNSAQVQAHIDAVTAKLKQEADAVSAAVNNAKET